MIVSWCCNSLDNFQIFFGSVDTFGFLDCFKNLGILFDIIVFIGRTEETFKMGRKFIIALFCYFIDKLW